MGSQPVVFNHVGLCVRDRAASRRFYEGLLGFEFWWELDAPEEATAALLRLSRPVGLHATYLVRDGLVLELLDYSGREVSDGGGRVMDQVGLTHISFSVSDLRSVLERVGAFGGSVVEGTVSEGAAMVRDPDGQLLELLDDGWPSGLPGRPVIETAQELIEEPPDRGDPAALQYVDSSRPDLETRQKPGTWDERNGKRVAFNDAKRVWELVAYEALVATARRYNDYVTYGQLAERVQAMSRIRTRSQMRNWIGGVLGAVAKRCAENGEPALSALCVKQDQTVGEGYRYVIELERNYGSHSGTEHRVAPPGEDIDLDMHAANARLDCYKFYGAELPEGGGEPTLPPKVHESKSKRQPPPPPLRPLFLCPVTRYQLPRNGWCDDCETFHQPPHAADPAS